MKRIFITLLLALISIPTYADKWTFKNEVVVTKHHYNDVTITQTRDTTDTARTKPKWTIEISKNDELVAAYKGFSFEQLLINEEQSLFVGLSNRGLTNSALIVFDDYGNLRQLINHNDPAIQYCKKSVVLIRHWYDDDEPNVEFHKDSNDRVTEISIEGCDGNRINLYEDIIRK